MDQAYLRALVERLGLDPSKRFREYSHGNKQKLGLVQAFMHKPRLLILDEPTSGLDPLNQQEFYQMVAEVRAEGQDGLPLLAHSARGRAYLRPRGDHP